MGECWEWVNRFNSFSNFSDVDPFWFCWFQETVLGRLGQRWTQNWDVQYGRYRSYSPGKGWLGPPKWSDVWHRQPAAVLGRRRWGKNWTKVLEQSFIAPCWSLMQKVAVATPDSSHTSVSNRLSNIFNNRSPHWTIVHWQSPFVTVWSPWFRYNCVKLHCSLLWPIWLTLNKVQFLKCIL